MTDLKKITYRVSKFTPQENAPYYVDELDAHWELNLTQLNATPEGGIITPKNIYLIVQWFVLVILPVLITIYHLRPMPESYKITHEDKSYQMEPRVGL